MLRDQADAGPSEAREQCMSSSWSRVIIRASEHRQESVTAGNGSAGSRHAFGVEDQSRRHRTGEGKFEIRKAAGGERLGGGRERQEGEGRR